MSRTRRLPERILHHQAASAAATAVDFLVMILAVSAAGMSPVGGTVLGAFSGAVMNFMLGRHWAFVATDGPLGGQAIRYALVSGTSLALNAAGEYVLAVRLGVGYVLARVAVSFLVSLTWNYPLQRFFVFARPAPAK